MKKFGGSIRGPMRKGGTEEVERRKSYVKISQENFPERKDMS